MNIRQPMILVLLTGAMAGGMFFTSPLLAASTNKNKKAKEELNTDFVEKNITDLTKKIKGEEKKKDKMPVTILLSVGDSFSKFAKHPEIEQETKIYKSWYSDIGKLCTAMGNLKYRFYAAKTNNDIELLKKCMTQYRLLRTKCLKLLENPKRIKTKKKNGRH